MIHGMYVCICHAVTDREIRDAVGEGASSLQELSFKTGCGTQCGCCVQQTREILNEELSSQGREPALVQLKMFSTA